MTRTTDSIVPVSLFLPGLLHLSLFLLWTSFLPGFVTGLKCYECLEIQCDSSMICESIKESIARTFLPNSHYIHFDPRLLCPSAMAPSSLPDGSSDTDHNYKKSPWNLVLFNCSRSDSVCLEAPIEVITRFDGSRNGKVLDNNSILVSHGYLRGCASRRGLKELPDRKLSVRKIYMDNETIEEELRAIGKRLARRDGYKITRIHYHEIHVDHGTINATRCYYDACNSRRRVAKSQHNAANTLNKFTLSRLTLVVLLSCCMRLILGMFLQL